VLGYKEGWALWLKKAGVKNTSENTGIQVDNSLMAFELAAHTMGIALGRTSMIAKDLRQGRLVAPFDLTVPIEEGFHLIAREDFAAHSHAGLFRSWLLQLANP
jgi:LysR family glycine cleavage system transcriptional activator